MKKGLKLILDLQSDQQALGSLYAESRGFQVFIGQWSEFPVLQQRSLPLQPGAEHRLDLAATRLTTNGIRGIRPGDRRCNFPDEGNLDFYKIYSQKSCLFECKIKYSLSEIVGIVSQCVYSRYAGGEVGCVPWFLPRLAHHKVCDPWTQRQFSALLDRAEADAGCSCLPDCESTQYSVTATHANFR